MQAEQDQKPIEAMSFEEALKELSQVVDRLERGDVPLDESIALYERGGALKTHCEKKLRDAELKVEAITKGADGEAAGTRPFETG